MTSRRDPLIDTICAAVRDEPGELDGLIEAATRRLAPLATGTEQSALARRVTAELSGLGELDALVSDPTIDEVLVNDREIWIDRSGRLQRVGELSATSIEQVIERILAPIGRRVDRTSPIVDARTPDGARVCAVVEPITVAGPILAIRRFSQTIRPLDQFTDQVGVDLGREIVAAECNVLVCGATSSGKTSLLASLVGEIDDAERIIVLEDTAELPCEAPHLVRMEARPASVDGPAAVSLGQLVRTAMRLRPDRLVVGEVRGDEVLALVQAMNTGHDGSFATCHANGPLDALLRLESLVLQAAPQWPLVAVREQLRRSIDIVVHVVRSGGSRTISSIVEVSPDGDGVRELAVRPASGALERRADVTRARRAA